MASKGSNISILGAVAIVLLIIGLGVGYLVGQSSHKSLYSSNPNLIGNQTASTTQITTIQPTTISVSTTTIANINTSQQSSSNSTVKDVIASKETVSIAAPTYNPYYNRVIGCYYVDGAYNFSFYAPYSGYVVFNETNTGIPNNFTIQYFAAYISRQNPRYFIAQPYNETSFCPGWTFLSTINPCSLSLS